MTEAKKKASKARAKYVTGQLRNVQAMKAKKLERLMRAAVDHPTMTDQELREYVRIQLDAERLRSQP